MTNHITPRAWRLSNGLSQSEIARRLGITGKNPARTWQRWETGKARPPINVVVAVEQMSAQQVDARSWLAVEVSHSTIKQTNTNKSSGHAK
ncbi:helix-turn-helix transcriptional regulator [Methylobacterium sp. WL69]|nr:helix-turn-helix transcriptional regulator [Methylobacterium sp. WL69]